MASRPEPVRRAYRIVSPDYPPFDGSGAYRWGSRWVAPGRWVVHAAETYALAVLENLVHWQTGKLPPNLVCVEAKIPDDVAQSRLDPRDIRGWDRADYAASRAFGNEWYDAAETAVLWVPSVVSPYESNALFNQRHEDFVRIIVSKPRIPVHEPDGLLDRCDGIGGSSKLSTPWSRKTSLDQNGNGAPGRTNFELLAGDAG